MANSRSVLLLLIVVVSLVFALCNSSPLVLPLSHRLSGRRGPRSVHHLLKSAADSSTARFRRHRQVSLPLSPGSDYTLSLVLNGQPASLYMDTGSDVVWLPCRPFQCILCEDKQVPNRTTPPLNLSGASTAVAVGCSSPACSAVHGSLSSSDLCAMAKCPLDSIEMSECDEASFRCPPFYYAYGDGSFVGNLYRSPLAVTSKLSVPDFTFGCAHTALGEPVGVAGFGRGSLSLPAQLARESPDVGNYFSYCLISHGFDAERAHQPSPLILGRYDQKRKRTSPNSTVAGARNYAGELRQEEGGGGRVDYVYTPMLENPKHPYFYCVGLEAVSIGKTRIEATESLKRVDSKGDGGMVVDSGTTYTMLPRKFYRAVVDEFHARMMGGLYRRAAGVERTSGLSPCYYTGGRSKAALENATRVPRLVFHFGGGGGGLSSSVVMPRRNYFYEFEDGGREVGCLMLVDGGDEAEVGGGPAGLLGNYQQQGFEVVYDLVKNRIGFARRKCAALWETLK